MSIRDIIEAATPGPWSKYPSRLDTATTVVDFADRDLCDVRCSGSPVDMHYATTRFIATFDPEHVALMEAVYEAVTLTVTPNTGAVVVRVDPHAIDAVAALVAYRKERGL